MAPICPDFKWFDFQILDPIQNPDHLQPDLFLTIQNLESMIQQILIITQSLVTYFISLRIVICHGQLKSSVLRVKDWLQDTLNALSQTYYPY